MSNELYEHKQKWMEAVMASDLGAATKVYAWGIFKHMYGNKMNSFPSRKAISAATGLATGKFYLHNQALEEAGFLKVSRRSGKVNLYELMYLPTEGAGTLPQKDTHPTTEEATPAHKRGTNTTSNTPKDTSMEDNKDEAAVAGAPNASCEDVKEDREEYVYMGTLRDEDFEPFPNLKGTLALDYLANSEGVKSSLSAVVEPPLKEDKDRVEGLEHLERLMRSRNISEEGREAARGRYDDPEYRPHCSGMQRAGWIAGEVQNEYVD